MGYTANETKTNNYTFSYQLRNLSFLDVLQYQLKLSIISTHAHLKKIQYVTLQIHNIEI